MTRPHNVAAALDALGIRYTIHGDEAQACCPAHRERRPSWSCNLITGEHNCFSCPFGGTFASLVAHMRGVTYKDAAEWSSGFLRDWREVSAALDTRDRSPRRQYQREAALALFTQPPTWARRERRLTAEACQAYGVLWDREDEAWILPIRDPDTGKLMGWQEKSRRHFRNRPTGVPKSETLFGYQALPEGGIAILVESPLDAVRIYAAGVNGAVASFGVEVSEAQLDLIVDRSDRLVVALDDDDAGDKRCAILRAEFTRMPMKFFNYADSGAKDPGEMTDEHIRWGIGHAISSYLVRS